MNLTPCELHQRIALVCPINGVSIGNVSDRSTWTFNANDSATEEQKVAAQAILDAAPIPIIMNHKICSPYEFYKKFTSDEKSALLASEDAIVIDFRQNMQLYQIVVLDGEECYSAMSYLVSIGILTEDRKNAILGA